MKKLLFVALLSFSMQVFALNYTISFTGSGASNLVGDVLVQNLTQGTSVTVPAGNVLNLTDAATFVDQQSAIRDDMFVYLDVKDGNSRVTFCSKQDGLTQLNAYGIDGRKLIGITQYLPVGENSFQLSLSKGAYIIQVVGNGYAYSAKLISQSSSQILPAIEYVGSQSVSSSGLQKSKSAVNAVTSMSYTVGDQLLYTAVSGNFSTVVNDKPTQDKTTNFNFVACQDADGNNYKTVTIGTQTWMAENLKTTKYRNNESIANITDNTTWANLQSGAWCDYNNDAANGTIYGHLYNWYSVADNRNTAPIGWHVATDNEWTTLTDYLGGGSVAGGKLKETGTNNWIMPNTGATNESGFSAFPGGYRQIDGTFTNILNQGSWWSNTIYDTNSAWHEYMYYTYYSAYNVFENKKNGFSLRCVKGDIPSLSTSGSSLITSTTASFGGNITSDGGGPVIARGVCWSTTTAPTVALATKTSDGSGIGAFTSSITGLTPNTTYYVRAYATNSVDTAYGNEVTFTTSPQNLLANPSFETWSAGVPTGWTLTSTVGGTVTQSATTSTGSGNSFQIANPTGTYIIQQNIVPLAGASTFDTNTTYKLSFSYLVTAGDGTDARIWSGLVTSAAGVTPLTYYAVPTTHADSLLYYIPLHGPGGNIFPPAGTFGNDQNGYLLDNRSTGTWHTYSYSFKFPAGIKQFNFAVRTYAASTVSWDDFFFGESSNTPITPSKPILTTINPVGITSFTASSGGNIANNGGADVTERGICWSTAPSPSNLLTTKTSDGSGSGLFSSTLTGLIPGVTYYIRAYATNSAGTAFGNEIVYTPVIVSNKILFDNTKAEQAGNADWVISNSANPTQFPTPDQSGITASTPETYWEGALSSWGIDCVKEGYAVETLPVGTQITYGDNTNTQDLSNYKVYVVCEPNIQFTDLEKTAIMNFVKNGGGLFMVSDHTLSDRNKDGWDSPAIWNDFLTTNSVEANPFGISFDLVDIVQTTTNMATLASDSILHGKMGDVTQAQWFNGTTMTLTPSKNPKVVGQIFTTGSNITGTTNAMFATSKYGKGKVAAIGDSSPCDDGTGGVGNTLYDGYWTDAAGNHRKLLMNATIWLAH